MPKGERTTLTDEHRAACPAGARVIPLTRGWVAWVDEADYDGLAKSVWHVIGKGRFYACRARYNPIGPRTYVYMHREILGASDAREVDHKEHREGLRVVDNRRENLRLCTARQNCHNSRPQEQKTSRFKGVYWDRRRRRWIPRIRIDGRAVWLGQSEDELVAAARYDAAALEYYGEFARLNLPDYSAHLSLETLIANGRSREASQPWDG